MEIRRALTIFRFQTRIPMEDLNSRFRELVKKYHPDKMQDFPEWSHERMSEINDAYETLAEWLSRPIAADKPQRTDQKKNQHETSPEEYPEDVLFRREIPGLTAGERKRFYPIFNSFLDGLGIYYQYGLENPAYRNEGIRRFRYREAFRTIEKAGMNSEKLSAEIKHPVIIAATRFIRLTAAEMNFGEPVFRDMITFRKFDDRLRLARRSFDDAVKEIFFPELIPGHLSGRATSGLYACYTSFVLYLTVFTEGERRKAGILMTARYDALMDLIEMRNDGILDF